jgi:Protein of unknown function (DUF3617)
MIKYSIGGLAAAGSFLLLVLAPARAADPPGVLWETTSQMVMEGMPMSMPPNTVKVCTAKEWTRPPPGRDNTCVNTNFQRVGNKATWTMQCGGDMPMTGTGEMTFEGSDSYTGVIKATAEGMNMTIKLSGKKVGTCDKPIQ